VCFIKFPFIGITCCHITGQVHICAAVDDRGLRRLDRYNQVVIPGATDHITVAADKEEEDQQHFITKQFHIKIVLVKNP
jgi:hypothetical protein